MATPAPKPGTNVWIASSESDGNAAFLADQDLGTYIAVYDAQGNKLGEGRFTKNYEDGRYIYRFGTVGNAFGSGAVWVIGEQGQTYCVGNPSLTWDNIQQGGTASRNNQHDRDKGAPQWDPATYTSFGATGTSSTRKTTTNYTNKPGVGDIPEPIYLDPNINEKTQLDGIELQFTDPIEVLRKVAEENNQQLDKNFLTALNQAGKLSDANTQQLIDYLDTMSPYQRQLIGIENAFNQQEKLKAAETAIPGVTDMLRQELKNAQTLASGRLLTDSEDRALEQTARSAGADAAWTRGLGDDSLIGQTLSDKLSVSQRNEVMKMGQTYLTQALQNATDTLMDSPQKATMGSSIPAQPQQTIADITAKQQAALNEATTISPTNALSSIVDQRKTQANLDWNIAAKNAELNEAYINRKIGIITANTQAENQYNADVQNYLSTQSSNTSIIDGIRALQNLKRDGKINSNEYDSLLAQVLAGVPIDPTTYDPDYYKKHPGNSQDNSNSTRAQGHQPDVTRPNNQEGDGGGQGGGNNGETTTKSFVTNTSKEKTSFDTTSPVTFPKDGTGATKVFMSQDGKINWPEINWLYTGSLDVFDLINDNTVLKGLQ